MKFLTKTLPSHLRPAWFLTLFLVLVTGMLAAGWAWYFLRDGGQERDGDTLGGLQVFGVVPEFSLIERHRRPVLKHRAAHRAEDLLVGNLAGSSHACGLVSIE